MIETIYLLFIGIISIFQNLFFFLYDLILFGKYSWWRKLRWHVFRSYVFTRIYGLVIRESEKFKYGRDNFIYGETPCFTLKKIFQESGCGPGGSFIDLGCGRGLTVFYAAYLKNMKAAGCELIPVFVERAKKIKKIMSADRVNFFEKDLLRADISKADLIYVAGTTFSEDFIVRLARKTREAKKGAVIVTLSYPLKAERLNLFRESQMWFSWGKAHVYFHRVSGGVKK